MVRTSNPKVKIPAKIARKMMNEEMKGAKEYRALGFPELAADEERHANFFKKILINKSKQQPKQKGGKK